MIYQKAQSFILLFVLITSMLSPVSWVAADESSGGCGGTGSDSDCDGYEAWGTDNFYDPYEQDLDDNDPSVGPP